MKQNEAGLTEAEIDGKKYEFERWGAEDSLDTLIDISQMVGKPLGMAIATMLGKEGLNKDVDPDMLGGVFEAMFQNLNKEKTKPLIKKLCSDKVLCDGKKINFNQHYAGSENIMHMFRVVQANLEVQYGNFFVALLELTKLRGDIKALKAL